MTISLTLFLLGGTVLLAIFTGWVLVGVVGFIRDMIRDREWGALVTTMAITLMLTGFLLKKVGL